MSTGRASARIFWPLFILTSVLCLIVISGCFPSKKPANRVEQYILEYHSPRLEGASPLDEVIKFERFSVASAYNSPAMVYRPSPFVQDAYHFHRWRVNPGDMVTDFLLRDHREAGLFRAVLSYHEPEDARYRVEGSVEEFLEISGDGGRSASLAVNVTLLDTAQTEVTARVVFQRSYRFTEKLKESSPKGLALAMSGAMEKFSGRLLREIHETLREREGSPGVEGKGDAPAGTGMEESPGGAGRLISPPD